MDVQLVYATFPDEETARSLGETLLEDRLTACFTFWQAGSWYRWEDGIERDEETLALFKTSPAKRQALVDALEQAHPYDVPCILPFGSEQANDAYTAWVAEETEA